MVTSTEMDALRQLDRAIDRTFISGETAHWTADAASRHTLLDAGLTERAGTPLGYRITKAGRKLLG